MFWRNVQTKEMKLDDEAAGLANPKLQRLTWRSAALKVAEKMTGTLSFGA